MQTDQLKHLIARLSGAAGEILPALVMDGHDSEDPKQNPSDMTAFVQNLLQQMQTRFQTMSDSIVTKIDEMGNRINELEQSINNLKAEMEVEGSPSPMAPTKPKQEEGSELESR